jgi:DNA-binding protein HU-beta
MSATQSAHIPTQVFNFQGGKMAAGMTKTQLVRHMAEKLETNNKTAAAFLEHLAETAIKETKKNGVFVIPGLGRLVKSNRKARMGRNPQTGEPIKIAAKTVVKFRVAKAVKDVIAPKK